MLQETFLQVYRHLPSFRCAAFVASYRDTSRILRESTAVTLPAELEASLKAFLRARTTAFRSS